MKRRILDLFKSMFKGRKAVKNEIKETNVPTIPKDNKFQYRKGTPEGHLTRHNELQAHRSKKVSKRRKANKVARKQRKVNR